MTVLEYIIMEEISIIYEDAHYIAVNKPAGLVVHPDGKRDEPALTDWILKNYPDIKGVGEPIELSDGKTIQRPGIVHRIDKETSGVLLIAKDQEAHELLKYQFQERTVKKKYYAFVYGELKDKYGIINRPMGRSKSDFRKWSATRGARGELREAETWYTVIKTTKLASYVLVEPKTGRTHQIRVHFAAINHPIVHDGLYAAGKQALFGFTRNALHAFSITFRNFEGKEVTVEAPLPKDFIEAKSEFGVAEI